MSVIIIYVLITADSHRAAIPALLMSRINLSNPEIEKRGTRKYVYNALEGMFINVKRNF